MTLSAFIRDRHEEIVTEFAVFATTLMPEGAQMTQAELRDHAEDIDVAGPLGTMVTQAPYLGAGSANVILNAVIDDMAVAHTTEEQSRKSQGRGSVRTMERSGMLHADD